VRTPILDLFRPGILALSRYYFGLRLVGVQHIPQMGPLVITPNHQTYADPVLVTIPVHRPIHYMAWSRLFTVPGLGSFIRLLRAFPVQIEGADPRAARAAARLLRAEEAVMIFPEGGRSVDGTVGRFKSGAFRLAVAHRAPGFESWPPGRAWPRRERITITYHEPLRPDPSLSPREAARDLADRTRAAILAALPASRGPVGLTRT